jgi:adenine-specific DNA-methyltransferase
VNFDSYVSATFYIIKPKNINLKYLAGILNSKLITFWLRHKGKMQGSNYQIDKEPLLNIPIYVTSKTEQHQQDKIVQLVEQMLQATQQIQIAVTDKDKNYYKNKCIAIDMQIDRLVYELYGLTSKDDISTVEQNI